MCQRQYTRHHTADSATAQCQHATLSPPVQQKTPTSSSSVMLPSSCVSDLPNVLCMSLCNIHTILHYCTDQQLHILHLLLQTQTLHILTNQSNHLTFSSHYLRITGNFPSMSVCPYFMSISRCTRVYEHAKFWILFNGCSGFLIANLM